MTSPEPYDALCMCPGFVLWYVDTDDPMDPWPVCRCGHPDREHLGLTGSCLGEVVVYPAVTS